LLTLHVSAQVIAKWELSGNGFGQRRENEDGTYEEGFGHLSEEHFQASDNRANFLGEYGEYILYMWDVFDNNDMLDTMLSVLSKDVAFESESDDLTAATTCSGNESTRRKKLHSEEMRQFRSKFSAAMSYMSYSSLVENLRAAKAAIIDYRLKSMAPSIDPEMKKALDQYIVTQEQLVLELKEKINGIIPDSVTKS
jgi:hypothetical protein